MITFTAEPLGVRWKPSTYTPLKYGKVYKYRCDRCKTLVIGKMDYCFYCYDKGIFLEDEKE